MTAGSEQIIARGLQMKAKQIAELLTADYVGENVEIHGVSTDTRRIADGQLFVALKGPNFDGHDFAYQAAETGAAACLVERPVEGLNCIVVNDTRIALGELAAQWRQRLKVRLIGITGSNGKTTVKEMLASILSGQGEVLATRGNLNNDIGMPLTLLELDERYSYAVIEMGANHPGEIGYLTRIAKPDVALITNAGMAHLEGFGSVEGVAHAKGEIYQGLGDNGIAIVNNEDAYADYWKQLNQQRCTISFGTVPGSDVRAEIRIEKDGQSMAIVTPTDEMTVTLKLLGKHNALNGLAAIAAAIAVDVPLTAIKAGLESLRPVNGRLQLKDGIKGSRIIDDTYNANPTSLYAALEALREFPGQHYLALGDMGELGGKAESLHSDAGRKAKESGVQRLYTLGSLARHACTSFGESAYSFLEHDDMIEQISNDLAPDVTLLVKGSRRMKMEKIVAACETGHNRKD
ncbi:UDP-N-acetylmuramoyl-tripeptide--D-alanyl-D-alanine ligase [Thiohalophilus thiocyanatoxydans]|uniref:UDP-N-acetylmuramoyl-tripeptide--D-alanyl-D-alanine ligase n=1 Tax=Thiohalophilus thiocyanatoxydans TaxID=381308 RepID=A0A4R8ILY5_9GAMM|nr:UDP-N-acetylmuramoyl-tripeptide--D-alanyl-D-alanine ligase [Thiohalophilus thiocyanatoxydans]TDY01144.1 UDP-N-acetylmuramoyl-tripeptide--D-alanyl-D-alanine ligase [Thiohalophilus thiocyanatoxydans]